MATALPALSLAAVPGRRRATLDLAREIERRGFAGIYCPSFGDGLGLCEALALRDRADPASARASRTSTCATSRTTRRPRRSIHELSGGRFALRHRRLARTRARPPGREGRAAARPTSARSSAGLRAAPRVGELPPIVLATLRKKMIALAGEIGDGMVFANGARSHMARRRSRRCPPRARTTRTSSSAT